MKMLLSEHAAGPNPPDLRAKGQGAQRHRLDAEREHFHHGPIDLIIGVDADERVRGEVVSRAWARFQPLLAELVSELTTLRQPIATAPCVQSPAAQRMLTAVRLFAPQFVTPMAAVAGAVADEIAATLRMPGVRRAYVNNGGDIALLLTEGEKFHIGLCAHSGKPWKQPALDGRVEIDYAAPVRGIATSGWRGRSFSLGIADSVTVLAYSAAAADAAATLIANAVDVDSPRVERAPANTLKDDTDLGARLVTVAVGELTPAQVDQALDAGAAAAQGMIAPGLIHAAVLRLKRQARAVGSRLPDATGAPQRLME